MSIIIVPQNSDSSQWVYLDNTTNYTKRRSKRLTSHPIEAKSGSSKTTVSDNAVRNNPTGSLSGSLSPWDFHLQGGAQGRALTDNGAAITTVGSITVASTISDYLPSSVTQYTDFSSDVKVADIVTYPATMSKEEYLESNIQRLVDIDESDELVNIYFSDYNGVGSSLVTGVVITSLVFSEDTNTGDSTRVDISYEQPTFAYISTTDVPDSVIEDAVAGKESGGSVTGVSPTTTNQSAFQELLNVFTGG